MRFYPIYDDELYPISLESFEKKDGVVDIPKNNSELVISRHANGDVISKFKDDVWDLTCYSIKNTRWLFKHDSINPKDEKEKDLILRIEYQTKLIMLLLLTDSQYTKGVRIKPSSRTRYFRVIKSLSFIAFNEGLDLFQIHESEWFFKKLIESFKALPYTSRTPSTFLLIAEFLHYVNNTCDFDCPVIVSYEKIDKIRKYVVPYKKEQLNRQKIGSLTPLIPTRIYANIIADATRMVNDFLEVSDSLIEFCFRKIDEPLFGVSKNSNGRFHARVLSAFQEKYGRAYDPTLDHNITMTEGVEMYGLKEYFEEYPIEINMPSGFFKYGFSMLRKHLGKVSSAARILILTYSGMRNHEKTILSHDCFNYVDLPEVGEIPIIIGRTSKFVSSNYSESELPWATCEEVRPAVEAARKISKFFIYANTGNDLSEYPESERPLFPILSEKRNDSKPNHYDFHIDFTSWSKSSIQFLSKDPDRFTITEEDLRELESFDAFANWRERKDFKVGNVWPFAAHQCRRATAVYGARSGLVDLPSLKFQFKHLSKSMTMLYRYDASFGRNLLDMAEKDGAHQVIADFIDETRHIEALNFINDIKDSSKRLRGASGARLQQIKDDGAPEWWDSPDEVKKKIASGEMAYRRTKVGGCSKWDMCEHLGVADVVPCLSGCPDNIHGVDEHNGQTQKQKLNAYLEEILVDLDYMDPNHPAAKLLAEEVELINTKLIDEEEL